MTDPIGPALDDTRYDSFGEHYHSSYNTLTKREWFAAKAMIGIIANNLTVGEVTYEMVAKNSVRMADALIAELSK